MVMEQDNSQRIIDMVMDKVQEKTGDRGEDSENKTIHLLFNST